MFTISGTLLVHTSQSREKVIKTGRLVCSLGEFMVKHDDLNLLQDGQYEGIFELTRIQQSCYEWQPGKFYVEIEAILNNIAFNFPTKSLSVSDNKQSENVADEKKAANDLINQPTAAFTSQETLPIAPSDDAALFGDLWPLGDEVQLDRAQSRDRLAAQSKRLSQLGYEHNMKTQIWHKAV